VVELREAHTEDASLLLAWRNDPETQRQSVSRAAITEAEHVAWLAASLASEARTLFVASHEGVPVGTARLDRGSGGAWEVSITVAPGARGRKLGTAILVAVDAAARKRDVQTLTARIRAANTVSVAAFKSAGYYAFVERTIDGEPYVLCQRRLASFGR
jgi:RimJ/RimL family protein N-acetyltransferase